MKMLPWASGQMFSLILKMCFTQKITDTNKIIYKNKTFSCNHDTYLRGSVKLDLLQCLLLLLLGINCWKYPKWLIQVSTPWYWWILSHSHYRTEIASSQSWSFVWRQNSFEAATKVKRLCGHTELILIKSNSTIRLHWVNSQSISLDYVWLIGVVPSKTSTQRAGVKWRDALKCRNEVGNTIWDLRGGKTTWLKLILFM